MLLDSDGHPVTSMPVLLSAGEETPVIALTVTEVIEGARFISGELEGFTAYVRLAGGGVWTEAPDGLELDAGDNELELKVAADEDIEGVVRGSIPIGIEAGAAALWAG